MNSEIKDCPFNHMPYSVWNKAYWDYDHNDWIGWLSSFQNLPIKEYNQHIENIVDNYLPDNLNFKDIYELPHINH